VNGAVRPGGAMSALSISRPLASMEKGAPLALNGRMKFRQANRETLFVATPTGVR